MGQASASRPNAPGAGVLCDPSALVVDAETVTVIAAGVEPLNTAEADERAQLYPAAKPTQERLTVPENPATGAMLIWYAALPLLKVCAVELSLDAPTVIAVPVPVSATVWGLDDRLSVMVNVPV